MPPGEGPLLTCPVEKRSFLAAFLTRFRVPWSRSSISPTASFYGVTPTQQKRVWFQCPMAGLDNGGESQSRRGVPSRGAVSMGSHSIIEVLLLRLAPPAAPV